MRDNVNVVTSGGKSDDSKSAEFFEALGERILFDGLTTNEANHLYRVYMAAKNDAIE